MADVKKSLETDKQRQKRYLEEYGGIVKKCQTADKEIIYISDMAWRYYHAIEQGNQVSDYSRSGDIADRKNDLQYQVKYRKSFMERGGKLYSWLKQHNTPGAAIPYEPGSLSAAVQHAIVTFPKGEPKDQNTRHKENWDKYLRDCGYYAEVTKVERMVHDYSSKWHQLDDNNGNSKAIFDDQYEHQWEYDKERLNGEEYNKVVAAYKKVLAERNKYMDEGCPASTMRLPDTQWLKKYTEPWHAHGHTVDTKALNAQIDKANHEIAALQREYKRITGELHDIEADRSHEDEHRLHSDIEKYNHAYDVWKALYNKCERDIRSDIQKGADSRNIHRVLPEHGFGKLRG